MKAIWKFLKTLIVYIIVRVLLWVFMMFYTLGLIIYIVIFKPINYILKLLKL